MIYQSNINPTSRITTMARKPLSESGEKKSAAPRGPQKRTFHLFYRAVDANGTPVDGVNVEIVQVITDARKVIEFMDSPDSAGLKRKKYEIVSTPRGDGEDDEAASAAE
jgi:hypothetical protein